MIPEFAIMSALVNDSIKRFTSYDIGDRELLGVSKLTTFSVFMR